MASCDEPLAATDRRRIAARTIDVGVALLLSLPLFPFGWLMAFAYLAVGDRLANGTLGSRLVGIRVVSQSARARLSRSEAFFRNLPWIVVLCLFQVPLWGGSLAIAASASLLLIEAYLLGRYRVGDGLDNLMGNASVLPVTPAAGS